MKIIYTFLSLVIITVSARPLPVPDPPDDAYKHLEPETKNSPRNYDTTEGPVNQDRFVLGRAGTGNDLIWTVKKTWGNRKRNGAKTDEGYQLDGGVHPDFI